MNKSIAVLAGDGIGPEVMHQTIRVLNAIEKKYLHHFELEYADIGGAAYDKWGIHFPEKTLQICQKSDAILFGSVGGPIEESNLPKWNQCERNSILALRKAFQLCINIRPAIVYPELKNKCTLKDEIVAKGLDITIIRELSGDIYFGEHKQYVTNNIRYAFDVAEYNEKQIQIVAHKAFQTAKVRKGKVTSVDKSNVLETSRLWREVVTEVHKEYPSVILEHMYVDNCAMQLFINPMQFDVIVTSNLFGDILSDASCALTGSIGLLPSASFNKFGFGLYEPAGGSAPTLANKNSANPVAQILSLALLLKHSFLLEEESRDIENAVKKCLENGFRTQDIADNPLQVLACDEFTNKVIYFISHNLN